MSWFSQRGSPPYRSLPFVPVGVATPKGFKLGSRSNILRAQPALECGGLTSPSHNRMEAFPEGVVKVEGKSIESGRCTTPPHGATQGGVQPPHSKVGLRPQNVQTPELPCREHGTAKPLGRTDRTSGLP